MKKYLNKGKFKLLIPILFISVFAVFLTSHAQTKLEYYQKVFEEDFGFEIYKQDGKEKTIDDFLAGDGKGKHLVLLSSSVPVPGLSPGLSPVILVCDSPFSSDFAVKFFFDSNNVSSNEVSSVGGFLRIDSEQNIDLWVIPESLLLTPEKRSETNEFFKAVKKADKAPLNVDKDKEEEDKSFLDSIREFSKTTVFETFSIAVSMFFIVILMHRILKLLSQEDKKISLSDIKDFFNVNKNMPLYQRIIFFGTICLIVIYLILMSFVSIKNMQKIDLGYILSYSIDCLNPKNIITSVSTGGYFRLIVFFYEAVVITLILVLLLPSAVKILKSAFFKISHARIKPEVKKYPIPILILVSLLIASFVDISESYWFLMLMMLILAFIIFKNKSDLDFINYSGKEKTWYVCTAILIVGLGFLLKVREKNVEIPYGEEDLIGVVDEAVVLPYSKQLGEKTLIHEYNLSGSWPVFVDHYLVYSPNHSRVENKNIKDFKKEGSFYIQNGDLEDIIFAIYSNEALANELISTTPTNFFRIKSLRNTGNDFGEVEVVNFMNGEDGEAKKTDETENINNSDNTLINVKEDRNLVKPYNAREPKIRITFSCKRQNIGINDVEADFYYLSKEEGGSNEEEINGEKGDSGGDKEVGKNEEGDNESKIETESETLFYFPGCSKIGVPQTYEVDFDTPYTDSDYLFVKLNDVLPEDIESIEIINGYEIINPVYFLSKDGYGILDSQEITTFPNSPIVNYIFGDSYDLSFDIVLNEDEKFDISKPINELIKEGVLKDRFLIWSTKKYLPVRLP
jgi:hypothetical protein